ncbi:glycosyltransferase family 2 protein [Vibrio natriegens]|uniref:glycosyltransferase family 2 protein n=1 Tax=Vibrio natriegens TaxID=691 RepID=UPI0035587558
MSKVSISFIIKALNEEENISQCIESCLKESSEYDSEIILVDSLSTDETVNIAKNYPIRIIQFERIEDCGCGAAAELGYQCSTGDYLFFLDGDMSVNPGFIEEAISCLKSDEKIAGVGGLVIDTMLRTHADRERVRSYKEIKKKQKVSSLGGGGLYKRSAIKDVVYFAHLGLKACEEAELGVRLRTKGYEIYRLPLVSVTHTGHNESTIEMYKRLWSNGRLSAYTSFIKGSLGKDWFGLVLKECWFVFIVFLSLIFLFLLNCFFSFNASLALFCGLWLVFFVTLLIKKNL